MAAINVKGTVEFSKPTDKSQNNRAACVQICDSLVKPYLTHSYIMTPFDGPEKRVFLKTLWEKEKVLIQALSPLPTMFSTLSKTEIIIFVTLVVCFQFGLVQNFVAWDNPWFISMQFMVCIIKKISFRYARQVIKFFRQTKIFACKYFQLG